MLKAAIPAVCELGKPPDDRIRFQSNLLPLSLATKGFDDWAKITAIIKDQKGYIFPSIFASVKIV